MKPFQLSINRSWPLGLLVALLVVACGGGSGGDTVSPAIAATNGDAAASAGGGASASPIRTRLNACPTVTASPSADARLCLVGVYEGKNPFTGEACSVEVSQDGTIAFSSSAGRDSFGLPYAATQFSKIAYTVIPGTSATGYTILWRADGPSSINARSANVFFKFNAGYDDKLLIDYTPASDPSAPAGASSCELMVP